MLLMQKLKNELRKNWKDNHKSFLDFNLKNVKINSINRGCYGFIRNLETNTVVYVNTESYREDLQFFYREAQDFKDYTGSINHFAKDLKSYVNEICKMLDSPSCKNGVR